MQSGAGATSPARSLSALRVVWNAWPPGGAVFILGSFVVTFVWLLNGAVGPIWKGDLAWLEPLAAILGGIGAFVIGVVLITRRVDSAAAEADTFGLARGLATGYYFNFVRPLVGAIRTAEHPLHARAAALGAKSIAGLLVGIPESMDQLDPSAHRTLVDDLIAAAGPALRILEIQVEIEGRPRPVGARLVVGPGGGPGVILDIPTTLSVIRDFAEHISRREAEASPAADDHIEQARTAVVILHETDKFQRVLEEFHDVIQKVGATERRNQAPGTLLHIVPISRLRRRLVELLDR